MGKREGELEAAMSLLEPGSPQGLRHLCCTSGLVGVRPPMGLGLSSGREGRVPLPSFCARVLER